MNNQIIDKIKGVIFGQAIGDALGLATEFMSKEEVENHYPNGIQSYSDCIIDNHRSRWKTGDWTDDTDQMLCILDSILELKSVDEKHIATQFLSWYLNNGLGIGVHTDKVFRIPQYASNPLKASEIVWNMSKKKSASNGAIMRTSILGVWEYYNSFSIKNNTDIIAKTTHFDPRCVGSCVIISEVISQLILNNTLTNEQLIELSKEYDTRIEEYILKALESSIASLDLADKFEIGYTLKTMAAGLWVLNHSTDYFSGISSVILEGGDADTNASVAGAILGAKFGYSGIPNHLTKSLLHKEELEEKTNQLILLLRIRDLKIQYFELELIKRPFSTHIKQEQLLEIVSKENEIKQLLQLIRVEIDLKMIFIENSENYSLKSFYTNLLNEIDLASDDSKQFKQHYWKEKYQLLKLKKEYAFKKFDFKLAKKISNEIYEIGKFLKL